MHRAPVKNMLRSRRCLGALHSCLQSTRTMSPCRPSRVLYKHTYTRARTQFHTPRGACCRPVSADGPGSADLQSETGPARRWPVRDERRAGAALWAALRAALWTSARPNQVRAPAEPPLTSRMCRRGARPAAAQVPARRPVCRATGRRARPIRHDAPASHS